MNKSADITDRLISGDRTALARLISWAEDADPRFPGAISAVFERVGKAARVGITGPPGAGKSSLVNELARAHRAAEQTVGILAVDPSSPFSGGALLGDRIRMEERTLDPGVFIRSMASRGSHGGLARASVDACDVMDAFGLDEILLETVGVGQAEYDVVSAADTVLVVLCPGAGDGIQAMKAGLLEVADVLVVNKCDLDGADRLQLDLEEAVLNRRKEKDAWRPPVVACSAVNATGISEVMTAIAQHRAYLQGVGLAGTRRAKRVQQVRRVIGESLLERLWEQGYVNRVESLLERGHAPYDVAGSVLEEILASSLGIVTGSSSTPGKKGEAKR